MRTLKLAIYIVKTGIGDDDTGSVKSWWKSLFIVLKGKNLNSSYLVSHFHTTTTTTMPKCALSSSSCSRSSSSNFAGQISTMRGYYIPHIMERGALHMWRRHVAMQLQDMLWEKQKAENWLYALGEHLFIVVFHAQLTRLSLGTNVWLSPWQERSAHVFITSICTLRSWWHNRFFNFWKRVVASLPNASIRLCERINR